MHLLFRLHASVEAEHVQHSKVNEGVSIFASILIYLRYRLEKEIEQLQQQKDSINRQRKLSQESDGKTLQQMEQQYTALVAKNMEINMACQELESEVSELQRRLDKVMPPVMTRKSFVAIALNLLFVLAFDRTGFSIHNVNLLLVPSHKDIMILLACVSRLYACSLENQAVGDDEASLGKGNVMDNQDTMDASS